MIPDREVFQNSVRILSLDVSASAVTQLFAPKAHCPFRSQQ